MLITVHLCNFNTSLVCRKQTKMTELPKEPQKYLEAGVIITEPPEASEGLMEPPKVNEANRSSRIAIQTVNIIQ